MTLTRDLWMWCLERNIHASARCVEHHSQHRVQRNAGQDKLESEPHDIPGNQCYGPLDMDLFASRLSSIAHFTSAGG